MIGTELADLAVWAEARLPRLIDDACAGPWEAAALLGLPPDGQLVVVAADTRGLAEESLPSIERRRPAGQCVPGQVGGRR